MFSTRTPGARRVARWTTTAVAAAAITAAGVGASSSAAVAAPGEQATARAGSCAAGNYSNPRYLAKYGGKQQRIDANGNGVATEPRFSMDSRANRRLVYTSTSTNIDGQVKAGTRNVYVVQRTGRIAKNGNAWQAGRTKLISVGQGGPADGDSYGATISGYTGARDAAKGPRLVAFLSRATNLPGGNPTGVSAYTANTTGGGLRRVNVPGEATGVGISGDSKVLYVTTTQGIYLVRGNGKGKRLAGGAGMNSPTTTLNGKQAAYGQGGKVFTITSSGRRKQVAVGNNPQADGGDPDGGRRQGNVRAVAFDRGGSAYRVALEGRNKGVKRWGRTQTHAAINGGGSTTVFGIGSFACALVQVLENGKRGGYGIPQGQCPDGQGGVSDVGVSTRYNYLAFTCERGGLFLFHIGEK